MERNPVRYLNSRYKIGTNEVVTWLATAARQRCDIAKVLRLDAQLTTASGVAKSFRTGKKARNKRGKAKLEEALHIELSTTDLLELTSQITAAATRSTAAPLGLDDTLRILEDVIKGRRECAEWHNDGEDGHQHFIDTLQQIFVELRDAPWKDRQRKTPLEAEGLGKQADTASAFHNAFAGLAIEDPDAMPLGQEPLKTSAVKDQLPPNTSFTLKEDPEQEKQFAIWCFLKQNMSMRMFVEEVWKEYLTGQCALQNAAQVTFAAANLAKDSAGQFCEDYPEFETFDDLATYLQITYRVAHGTAYSLECMGPHRPGGYEMEQLTRPLCLRAFLGALLLQQWQSNDINECLKASAHARTYHTVTLDYVELHEEVRVLLGTPGGEAADNIGGADPFLHNFCDLMQQAQGRPEIGTVVVLEMEMCISDILGPARQHLHKVLTTLATQVGKSLDNWKSFVQSTADEGRPLFHLDMTASESDLRRLITKGVPMQQSPAASHSEMLATGHDSKYVLARMSMTAGVAAMRLHSYWHMETVPTANHHYVLQSMAHLYRALRAAGLITSNWQDMELFVEAQGAARLGLRDIDRVEFSFLNAAKNYGLAFGVPAVAFARQRSRRPRNPRVHIPNIVLHRDRKTKLLTVRVDNQPNIKHTSHITEVLWASGPDTLVLGTTRQGTTQGNLHNVVSSLLSDSYGNVPDNFKQQWANCKQLTPLQLLLLTKQSLKGAELTTNLDYLRLFELCYTIFRKLFEDHETAISASQIAEGLRESETPREVVDELLWGAALQEIGQTRPLGACGLEEIRDVALLLQDWIDENGSLCSTEALSKTSGHFSKDLVPEKNLSERRGVNHTGYFESWINGALELRAELPKGFSIYDVLEEMKGWMAAEPRSKAEAMAKARELASEMVRLRKLAEGQ